MSRDKGFFNAFILLPPENWPKKTAHRFLMCCRSADDCWLLSKEEWYAAFSPDQPFTNTAGIFLKQAAPISSFWGCLGCL